MRPRLSHSTVVRHTAVSRGHRLEACGSDSSGSLGVQRSSRPRAIASCGGADLAVNRGIWAGVRSFGSHVQFSRELFCSVAEVACTAGPWRAAHSQEPAETGSGGRRVVVLSVAQLEGAGCWGQFLCCNLGGKFTGPPEPRLSGWERSPQGLRLGARLTGNQETLSLC